MAISDSDSYDEPFDSLAQLKDKVRGLSKAKLEQLLFTLMDGVMRLILKIAC